MKFFGVIKSVKVLKDRISISVREGPVVQAELPRHTYPRAGDYIHLDGMLAGWCPRVGGTRRPLELIGTDEPTGSRSAPPPAPNAADKPDLQLRSVAEGKGTVLAQYVGEDRVRLVISMAGSPNRMLLVVDKTPTTCSIGPKDMLVWDSVGLYWRPLDRFGRDLCTPQPVKGRNIETVDKEFFLTVL